MRFLQREHLLMATLIFAGLVLSPPQWQRKELVWVSLPLCEGGLSFGLGVGLSWG